MLRRIKFILNNQTVSAEVDDAISLLEFIREHSHLKGTKLVCKEGDCGACTVLVGKLINGKVNYKTVTSCIYPLGNIEGCHVVTIEGLNEDELIPQQQAFLEESASQCGFCTPGYIVSLTGYLINSKTIEYNRAIQAIAGNICRCTGYESIKRAVAKLEEIIGNDLSDDNLIEKKVIPAYFKNIPGRLKALEPTDNIVSDYSYIVGGGSDLYVQRAEELRNRNLFFVNKQSLNFIEEGDNSIIIGAGTTFEEFKNSNIIRRFFPSLEERLNLLASLPVRNMATIGGNLVNASPIGDMTIILLALNANLKIDGVNQRNIPLNKFYSGYKTLNMSKGEYIHSIEIPKPEGNYFINFEKVSKRKHLDIASVNTAFYATVEDNIISMCRISAGGVAPVPKYLRNTSEYLSGKELNESNIAEAINITHSEISPIDDVRGSAEYKQLLLTQLIKAHFIELFPSKVSVEELI